MLARKQQLHHSTHIILPPPPPTPTVRHIYTAEILEDLGHPGYDDPAFNAPIQGGGAAVAAGGVDGGGGGGGAVNSGEAVGSASAQSNTFNDAKRLVAARQAMQQALRKADINVTAQSLRQRALVAQSKTDASTTVGFSKDAGDGEDTGTSEGRGGGVKGDADDDGSLL